MARIFESFEQVDGSEAREHSRTGLGLSVTRQLIELHGGEISVKSRVNQGSVFSFTLPVAGSDVKELRHEQDIASLHHLESLDDVEYERIGSTIEQSETSTRSCDFRILLVDDEPVNLQVLNNHLANQPYQLVKAASGEKALNLIEQGGQFDLILLDIMMPKVTGYQVCQAVRKLYAINDLPVIFLTAKNQVADLVRSYQVGANDYLAKPVAKHELLSRVETQLRLLDINRNLEKQVKQRTNDLLLADKMASLGTLTAGVAHEINNPNNFINVSLQNMDEDLDKFKAFLLNLAGDDADEEITASFDRHFNRLHTHVNISIDGSNRIKTIVDDLRTFTQLDKAEQNQVCITDLIRATVTLVQAKYMKLIDFDLNFTDKPLIECYPAQLNQVFMNIIVNACQAIEESMQGREIKGHIAIGCTESDDEVEITIKDDGCGMDEVTLTHVFEPFYTTKEVGEGTGLGMSISFGIIEKHGGDIKVNSILGEGSEFIVHLPLNYQSEKQSEQLLESQ